MKEEFEMFFLLKEALFIIAVVLFSSLLRALPNNCYPRVGAMHSNDWGTWWQAGEIERLARFDVVDIAPNVTQSVVDSIRMLSVGKTMLGHHGPSVYYRAWVWDENHPMYFDHVLFDTVMARGLWMYSVDSTHTQHCYTATWEGNRVLNLTTWAPEGPEGLPAPYWIGRYYGQAFRDRRLDGWVYDYGTLTCSWFEGVSGLDHNGDGDVTDGDSCFPGWEIDANNDFLPDDDVQLDTAWHEGMGLFLDGLADGGGPDFRIVGGGDHYSKIDGMWFERFLTMRYGVCSDYPDTCPPYWEYRFQCTMFTHFYASYLEHMDALPSLHIDRLNLLAPSWSCPTCTRFAPDTSNSELMRHLRLSMGAALLGDGFCSLVGINVPDVPDYQTSWWFDLYEYDLGQPLGSYFPWLGSSRDSLIWRREFEFGHVLVNTSCNTVPADFDDDNRPATPTFDASIWGEGAKVSPRLHIHYPDSTTAMWSPCSYTDVRFHARPFDYPTSLDLFLSTDGGLTIAETLATSVTAKMQHQIRVPYTPSNHCRIMGRLIYDDMTVWDTSNTDFTIGDITINPPSNLTILVTDSGWVRLNWFAWSVHNPVIIYRSLSATDTVGQPVDTTEQTYALFPTDSSRTVFWWVKRSWNGCP
jgi:hypothetical protein